MRHDSGDNLQESEDTKYAQQMATYMFEVARVAHENEAYDLQNQLEDMMVAMALVKSLQRYFKGEKRPAEKSWDRGSGHQDSADALKVYIAGFTYGKGEEKEQRAAEYILFFEKRANEIYGVTFTELDLKLQIRVVLESLGLKENDFHQKSLQELMENSAFGERFKKLIEGQGDYSFLL